VAGGYGEREHGPSGDDPKEEAEAEAVVVVVGMVGSWEVEVGFSLPLCSCTAMGQWREGGRRVVESRGEGRGGEGRKKASKEWEFSRRPLAPC
jgi:hypothetical protein